MRARPADLVKTLDVLLERSLHEMDGAFAVGPTHGDDVLPVDPIEGDEDRPGTTVPLIVGTNADERASCSPGS